jgi:hypothetical protein
VVLQSVHKFICKSLNEAVTTLSSWESECVHHDATRCTPPNRASLGFSKLWITVSLATTQINSHLRDCVILIFTKQASSLFLRARHSGTWSKTNCLRDDISILMLCGKVTHGIIEYESFDVLKYSENTVPARLNDVQNIVVPGFCSRDQDATCVHIFAWEAWLHT